jgi:SAM-dependent methyltransferase
MDLRANNFSKQDLEPIYKVILNRKLGYQPFIFSDELEVGEGYAFMTASSNKPTRNIIHWPGGPDEIKELLVPLDKYKEYQQANNYLRTIYDSFISFICENLRSPLENLEFLEFGCNTGYFVQRLSQNGARRAIGMDQTTNEGIFEWFNQHLGTTAEFRFAEWDSYSHSVRYAEMPEVDVVLSVAVLCHINDLLHHLTYLCAHAREAVFVWTPVRDEDDLLISFGPPSLFSQCTWPLSFDHLIRPTRKLIQLCLEKCGFEEMIFLPQFSGVNDWYQAAWKDHIGVLAFRTSRPKTIFDGGRRRLTIPPDALLKSEKYIPLDQVDTDIPKIIYSTAENCDIFYYRNYFYAIPRNLGPVNLGEIEDYASQGITRAESLELLFERIPSSIAQCRVTASSNLFEGQDISPLMSSISNYIWHAASPPKYPEWITMEYCNPSILSEISLQSQDSSSSDSEEYLRAPKRFILKAGQDMRNWLVLLEIEDAGFTTGSEWKTWPFANNEAYKFYQLVIEANSGNPDFLTLQKIKMA